MMKWYHATDGAAQTLVTRTRIGKEREKEKGKAEYIHVKVITR